MDRFFRSVLSIREVKYRHDDDFADRLSRHYSVTLLVATAFIISTSSYVGNPISCWCPAHFTDSHRHYTTGLLVAAAFIVSTKQFVGDPIVCWCPAHFTDSHKQYTNNICWISNHYYIPFDHKIPDPIELQRREPAISYYQWVPMLLLGQALVAFTPSMIWRFFNVRAGIDVSSLMDVARVSQRAAYSEMREKTVRYLVNQIDRYLLAQRDYRTGCCVRLKQMIARYCFLVGGKRHGNYLTVTYLFVKFLYAFNAIGQILLLDIFMGGDYHMYGVYVIVRLFRGEDWTLLERFPRVTLCDFKIRHNARLHDYVVQCALTINLFNEKIFLMLWYWWVFVALCTVVSSIQWIIRSLYWPGQVHFVKKKLRAFDANQRTKGTVQKFVQFYLRRDGIFLIRLISMNISDMIASEALRGLWESYGPERRVISENPAKSRRAQGPVAVPAPSAMGTMEVV